MRCYRLDAADVVRTVAGEWDSFATLNGGPRACGSMVIGRAIWDMMQGAATVRFLDELFYDCRKTQTAIGLLYRCDSPAVERLFHMRVTPAEQGGLWVRHDLIRSRPMADVALRTLGHLRYRKCSQCLACNFGGPWVAALHFKLLADAVAVDAVCPVCQAAAYVTAGGAAAMRPGLCG